jgi:hypothetical protein
MIPRVIHFIWISAGEHPSQEQLFGVKTAVLNTTCHVVLHTDDDTIDKIPGVEIRKREFPKEINGVPFNPDDKIEYDGDARRVSHVKDIVRLEILHKEGGVYSDLDVLWLRNPYEFWDKRVVIGFTNKGYKILANAVMMARAGEQALITYRDWLVSIYPSKKYWIPANPYKLWKDDPSVTMAEKYIFYPVSWKDSSEVTFEDIQKSVAIHEFASMGGNSKGEVIESLKKDYLRFQPCQRKNKTMKRHK